MTQVQPTDYSVLKYVMYVRKSTEDDNRQVRSIEDQIKDCTKLAEDLGLRVVDILKETKSAKKPGQRPVFDKMIKGLESKKYDALLCWHPDRLCRNMLEGGYIINMLDEGKLTDIRFSTHSFSNDAAGKMLLGMLFVFSKQYSDDLSDKVNRGVKGNFNEGKSVGTPKWGYDRSEITGLYEPNKYFELIKQAWLMRLNGDSLVTVTDFLNGNGVKRVTKDLRRQRDIRPMMATVSKMFRDPFYYGLLVQGKQTIDLIEVANFIPITTKEDFESILLMSKGRTKDANKKKRVTFYPLHGFVFCEICKSSKYMIVGKNKNGSGNNVLTYRCNNKECLRKVKSMRAKYIFNSVYEMLETVEFPESLYEEYSMAIDSFTDEKVIKIKRDIGVLNGRLNHIKNQISELSISIARFKEDSATFKATISKIDELSKTKAEIENTQKELKQLIANPSKIKLNKEKLLNLLKSLKTKMMAGSAAEKDALCRILFLNVHVNDEKVIVYQWRKPFDNLVKMAEINSGGAG